MRKGISFLSEGEVEKMNKKLKQKNFYDSSVNVKRFINARISEIQNIEYVLKNKKSSRPGKQRVHQRIPRHLRRRAMSHNYHLLPKYIRGQGAREHKSMSMKVQRRKKRKRVRRRLQRESFITALSYDSPATEFSNLPFASGKRLVTHMYHAKRMKMRNLWNMRLGFESVHKVFRTAYRFRRQHSTIYDASYLVCVQLEGTEDAIVKSLRPFGIARSVGNAMYVNGERELLGIMFEKYGVRVHCPVKILWYQQSGGSKFQTARKCWIWLHPASLPGSFDALAGEAKTNGVGVKYRNDLCRFEVRGKFSTGVLKDVLSVDVSNEGKGHRMWKWIECAGSLPGGMAVMLHVRHPLASVAPDLTMFQKTGGGIEEEEEEEEEDFGDVILDIPKNLVVNNTLFDERSTPSDSKKGDGDLDLIQMAMQIEGEGEEEEDEDKDVEMEDKPEAKEDARKRFHGVVVIQVNENAASKACSEFGCGWDVICSYEIGVHLWMKMAKFTTNSAAVKVLPISLYDRDRLLLEQNVLRFPQDYPDAICFGWGCTGDVYECGYVLRKKKKRKGKRNVVQVWDTKAHFQTISKIPTIERVFYKGSSSQFTHVQIHCQWGGVPSALDRLFLSKDDSELTRIERDPKQVKKDEDEDEDSKRACVGVVTSGVRSLSRGRGFGIAYVWTRLMRKIPKKKFVVLLMENGEYLQPVKCHR